MEWSKAKRVYFVIYSVLVGPPLGFFLLLFALSLYQQNRFLGDGTPLIALFAVAYAFGALQALLTALLIIWRYVYSKAISVWGLLICSMVGWLFGNWVNYDFAFRLFEGRGIRFNGDTNLLLFSPLIFGALMAILLWYFRPQKWVGP